MIGTTYKRRAKTPETYPATVRVTGQYGSEWTVTDAEHFGPAFALTPSELASLYNAPAEVPPEVDEIGLRRPAPDALHAAMARYRTEAAPPQTMPDPDTAPSPEDVFRRAAVR